MLITPQLTPAANHCDELVAAVLCQLEWQLPSQAIAYIWPQSHRVTFRTADGRTGDVEILVNWDVAPTESVVIESAR